MPKIKFREIKVMVGAVPCRSFWKRSVLYCLSDFSYGEFILLQNGLPKFYYNGINPDTTKNLLMTEAAKNNLEISKFLILMLEKEGFTNVSEPKMDFFSVRDDSKMVCSEYDLLEILYV